MIEIHITGEIDSSNTDIKIHIEGLSSSKKVDKVQPQPQRTALSPSAPLDKSLDKSEPHVKFAL